MNLRRRLVFEPIGFQLAPMIDVILFLLSFFLLTWNLARYEADLSIKVPKAKHGQEPNRLPGEAVVNVSKDGKVNLNRRVVSREELEEILKGLVEQYPDQAVIIRADSDTSYQVIVNVLDVCRAANVWNIAFATTRPEEKTSTP
ncbi:ExbD/TolR family protein [Candidatus Methylacidithermus pantelleriae]|uniref:Biopolymer transport protein ExbD/TolR n=1 Tax=Candidatus Methylacidithermus pantelleriae TaxID=2744239 RepID=A0A8J2BRH5_9BACT|nr:biopolymer transporter ExbD [Candidatus Methylacidithermus pantelleriae]CAF0693937.1 Biopolymer transport protein ExbD/TolR [Candidatus Methylacidithermus pantelleriae]